VLDLTTGIAGPYLTKLLADAGADVVKVEPPGGTLWERNWSGANLYLNGMSGLFLAAHRNQRSLTLDLKKPDGLEVARRMVQQADVLVQNFRPGVMTRLGLDYERAKALNPRLVYVSASGYGESSPYRERPGQDLLMQATTGLASISGRSDQPPTAVGTAVVDQHGASLLALGVLAALLERQRTGQGLHVEVNMLRAALDLQLEIATYVLNGARLEKTPTPLASTFHPPPYGLYATADGWLALSMSPLASLRDALELPGLEPYTKERWPYESREAVARLIEPVIRKRTTAEWLEHLVPLGIWAAPVLSLPEALRDPAVLAADAIDEIDHPVAGRVRVLRFPVELSTGRATVRRPQPTPGQHSEEILKEYGYADDAVRRLREAGVV
jgi:crotonobetainyl-CoA:carnitine CoA-transferase CaiB-like acyl-CoA transferase